VAQIAQPRRLFFFFFHLPTIALAAFRPRVFLFFFSRIPFAEAVEHFGQSTAIIVGWCFYESLMMRFLIV
jgi:hypothetical protein